jgi:hypothetical protein
LRTFSESHDWQHDRRCATRAELRLGFCGQGRSA